MYVPVFLVCFFCVLTLSAAAGSGLSTCVRNYEKVGCYDEYNADVKDLVVYDRFKIKWADIVGYMHHLACTCDSKTREANKERSGTTQYVGFALHFWGECYGRTQAQMDALASRSKSDRCTGDQTYTKCYDKNPECTGHAFSEFVYKLKPAADEVLIYRACEEKPITLSCDSEHTVSLTKLSYKERTGTVCGKPLSVGWKPECSKVAFSNLNNLMIFCGGKSSCTISSWTNDPLDPCPKVTKRLEIEYKCKP